MILIPFIPPRQVVINCSDWFELKFLNQKDTAFFTKETLHDLEFRQEKINLAMNHQRMPWMHKSVRALSQREYEMIFGWSFHHLN